MITLGSVHLHALSHLWYLYVTGMGRGDMAYRGILLLIMPYQAWDNAYYPERCDQC